MECKRVKMTKTISKKKIDVLISLAIRTYSKVISITLDRVLVQDMKKKNGTIVQERVACLHSV